LKTNADETKCQRLSSPGIGYNPSQELGGNKDCTFSKGWAAALPSNTSRKATKFDKRSSFGFQSKLVINLSPKIITFHYLF